MPIWLAGVPEEGRWMRWKTWNMCCMKMRTESGWLSVDVEFNLGVRGIDGEFESIEAFST